MRTNTRTRQSENRQDRHSGDKQTKFSWWAHHLVRCNHIFFLPVMTSRPAAYVYLVLIYRPPTDLSVATSRELSRVPYHKNHILFG